MPTDHGEFRVIAFDMPWHGKSSPPEGWHEETYRLTSQDYAQAAGQIAGMVNKEQTAKEIIEEIFTQAEDVLKGATKWVK